MEKGQKVKGQYQRTEREGASDMGGGHESQMRATREGERERKGEMRALMVESDKGRHGEKKRREGHEVCCLQKCVLSPPALK